jgi:PadR family transcriptional regulator PadR
MPLYRIPNIFYEVKHFLETCVYIFVKHKYIEREEMEEISRAEEMVLLAIYRFEDEAYGVSIRRRILRDTGKDYTYGTLYGLLRQMDHKGYIQKIKGDPLPRKGGRSRSYFKLTPMGIQALKDAIELHKCMWKGLSEISLVKS